MRMRRGKWKNPLLKPVPVRQCWIKKKVACMIGYMEPTYENVMIDMDTSCNEVSLACNLFKTSSSPRWDPRVRLVDTESHLFSFFLEGAGREFEHQSMQ